MKIGFDARFLSVPGGIPRYCRELLLNYATLFPADEILALVKQPPANFPAANITWLPTDIHWYGWAEQIRLGRLMNRQSVDLWHLPHWNVPITLRRPFVVTVHDLILEHFPTKKIKMWVWRWLLRYNLRRARAIICPSEFVRAELSARFPEIKKKITVIHNAAGELPVPADPSRWPQPPFFLAVGNCYPHKNLRLLLAVWQALPPNISPPLYILTHRDRFSKKFQEDIQTAGLADRIHLVFNAPDEILSSYYQNCTALLFPSLMEGFGIPPLEAFQFGRPVIAIKTASLPEILGEEALWVEPNAASFVTAIIRLLNTPNNDENASERRRQQAKKFSWQRTAISTHNLYRQSGIM